MIEVYLMPSSFLHDPRLFALFLILVQYSLVALANTAMSYCDVQNTSSLRHLDTVILSYR